MGIIKLDWGRQKIIRLDWGRRWTRVWTKGWASLNWTGAGRRSLGWTGVGGGQESGPEYIRQIVDCILGTRIYQTDCGLYSSHPDISGRFWIIF